MSATPAHHQSPADLENRFRYHAATSDKRRNAHTNMRTAMLTAAYVVQSFVPAGREQALAITKLEEAMFWANAGIARQPDGPVE